MTTPSPTQRLTAGHAAQADQAGSPPVPLTSTQAAYLEALRSADTRGERLTPGQRMQLGYLQQQHDAAQAVTA